MKPIIDQLADRVRDALVAMGVEGDPLIRTSQDAKFGDYQSNCAMGLGKKLGQSPRDVAGRVIELINVEGICETPEIAGPGFINFRLTADFLAKSLQAIPRAQDADDDRVGIDRTANPQKIAVDLSSPNLAKEMHVGHLRSTVIGDCISRVLEFEGHDVLRENHVGDWGTQFGMLVAYLRATHEEIIEHPGNLRISDLESFYVKAKAKFDADDEFKRTARETVVALQQGDSVTRSIWSAFCDESLRHCHAIYDRLGVELVDRGESFYADLMEEVVQRLETMQAKRDDGLIAMSDGALCLFMDGFKTRDGNALPMIVRKSDGGFNYATSDLATIIHRVESERVDRIIYIVGITQKQHFQMLFAAVKQLGWAGEDVDLKHLGFGSMLSKTGRPFKTREGGTVKLKDLLDQAVARAREVIDGIGKDETEGTRSLGAEQADVVAERIGLAAVKYFDLSHSLSTDYKFDLDAMLAMEGNTAPYMMYAYARIRSIGRKAGVDLSNLPDDADMLLDHPAEIALATTLLQFAETVDVVGRELKPNFLTEYLYELAKTFSRFYDRKLGVRVIDASPESVRISRLRLCDLTARVLRLGLSLLGIETVEHM